jgi:peptide/nickel transport system substrate-binding protein
MGMGRRGVFALLGATALLVTACGGGSYDDSASSSSTSSADGTPAQGGSAEGAAGGSLTVNMAVAPGTIDPAMGCGFNDLAIAGNLYSKLTQYATKPGPDGTQQIDPSKIEPYAAASWKTSDAGKTYTFTLKPGMKFPSGKPVDAAAVKYSVERNIEMKGCGYSFLYDLFLDPPLIRSIQTPDASTVVFHLRHADPNFPQGLAQPSGGIVDKSVVDAHGGVKKTSPNKWMQSHAAGAGPFLLQSYEPNTKAVLTANPDFVGPAPASKKLTINFINSDPTLLLQARSGSADVTLGLTKQSVNSLKGNGSVRIIANDTSQAELIGMPNTKPPFDNKTFREALSYAIPYDQIVQKAAFGYGATFFGPIIPTMAGFDAEQSKARPYDTAKAKQLIEQSGVKTPVKVEMVVQDGNATDEQIATIAQGEWRKLGVNVRVRKLAPSEYIGGLQAHKYQSFVRLDGPGVIDSGYFLDYDMRCKVVFNLTEACLPEADKLLTQARTETDAATREQLYAQITKLWIADTPKIPVYMDKAVAVLGKGVKGYLYSHETDMRTWSK